MKTNLTNFLMVVTLLLTAAGQGSTEEKKFLPWITEKEAALPAIKPSRHRTEELPRPSNQPYPADKQAMAGPIIQVEKPDADQTYKDLIDILIRFEKNPIGEHVNMKSLRIIYLKMFGIDITDRIRPYIRETRIDAQGIMFPQGEHEFEIRIQDKEQLESSKIITVRVG